MHTFILKTSLGNYYVNTSYFLVNHFFSFSERMNFLVTVE